MKLRDSIRNLIFDIILAFSADNDTSQNYKPLIMLGFSCKNAPTGMRPQVEENSQNVRVKQGGELRDPTTAGYDGRVRICCKAKRVVAPVFRACG
jgi:hypothetical protein